MCGKEFPQVQDRQDNLPAQLSALHRTRLLWFHTTKKIFNESFSNIVLRIAGKSDLALVQLKKGPGHKNATVTYFPKCGVLKTWIIFLQTLCISPQYVGDRSFERLLPRKFLYLTATGTDKKSEGACFLVHKISEKCLSGNVFFKCRWFARHQDEVHVHLQVRRGWMGKGFYFRIENIKGKTEWVKQNSLHSLSRATWRGTRSTTSSAPGTNLPLGRAMWENKKMKWGGKFRRFNFFVDSRCGHWTCGESCSEQRRGHCALGRKKINYFFLKIYVCQMLRSACFSTLRIRIARAVPTLSPTSSYWPNSTRG